MESATTPASATTPSSGGWPGGWAALQDAWERVKKDPVLPALYVGLSIVYNYAVRGTANHPASIGKSSTAGIVLLVFAVALPTYALATADGKARTLGQYFVAPASTYIKMILSYIMVLVILAIAAVLLIVPLVWAVPWISFVAFGIVEKQLSPGAAFSHSRELADNHKGKVWGIIGVSFLVAIVASIIAVIPVIGWLISSIASGLLGVVSYVAVARLYRTLQKA